MAIIRRKDSKNRVLKEGEYQRKNGTYEYKWRDSNGMRYSVSACTLELLREKEETVLKNRLDGIKFCKNTTIDDLYYRWLELKRGIKRNTLAKYQFRYKQYIMPKFGVKKAVDLKKLDVKAFYLSLIEQQGLSVSSVESIHTVLHQVLEIGVEDDYLRRNPTDSALKELKKELIITNQKKRSLTIAQQQTFEAYLKKEGPQNRWMPIFTVMLWTGMRVGETTGLRWCDIDFENNEISVNHTLGYYSDDEHVEHRYIINTPKTISGNRVIPMLPIVKEAFELEKQYQECAGIKCKAEIEGYSGFVFTNRFGNVHNLISLNSALRRIVKKCNDAVMMGELKMDNAEVIPYMSCHIFRHTFTTRLCEANVNIKVIQYILGHSDIKTTLDVYADATKEMNNSEMICFQEFFEDYVKRTM